MTDQPSPLDSVLGVALPADLATQAVRWRVKTGPMPADIFGIHDDKTLLVGLTGWFTTQQISGKAVAIERVTLRRLRARDFQ